MADRYGFYFNNPKAAGYAVELAQKGGVAVNRAGNCVTITADGYRSQFGQSWLRSGSEAFVVANNVALDRITLNGAPFWPED